ncbi:MAG TPA: DoxX family protein [Terriglobales bacterium]|nr:DoxX family protein [Terriglobales bacterium]
MTNWRAQDWGLLVLRVVVGIVALIHGGQKLFVFGLGGTVAFFGKLGLPAFAAYFAAFAEFLGGASLLLGVLTRVGAALLVIDMLGAIFTVHLKNGFFNPLGFEYPLTLLAANLCLLIAGAGALSVDAAIWKLKKL